MPETPGGYYVAKTQERDRSARRPECVRGAPPTAATVLNTGRVVRRGSAAQLQSDERLGSAYLGSGVEA